MARVRTASVTGAVVAAAFGLALIVSAQTPDSAPQLKILSPGEDSYVSGPTLLRASIVPAEAASSMTFFVDGRQVCALTRPPFECEWDAGPALGEHQVRAVATLTAGGRAVQTIRTKAVSVSEKVNVDVVQVTVTVSDGHGRFVRNLPRTAFRVLEDGKPQGITHFTSEDVPLEIVVAIDISGSMTPAMPKLKKAVKEFLKDVPNQDLVTLLGFNDSIFTLTRRSTDPAERAQAIDRLAPWGGTALYDLIISTVDSAGADSGRKAIVVFTDGEDQGSRARIEDVEQSLQSSDVTLYMIAQGRGTSLDAMKTVMRRLAEPTGGRALFTEDIAELHNAFAELLDELSNQYLLGYVPTNAKRDGTLRTIKVQVDGHSSVRARKSYRFSPLQ